MDSGEFTASGLVVDRQLEQDAKQDRDRIGVVIQPQFKLQLVPDLTMTLDVGLPDHRMVDLRNQGCAFAWLRNLWRLRRGRRWGGAAWIRT